MKKTSPLIIVAIGLVLASSLIRAGGKIEINQVCVADGCFAGDFPGYPITISSPGSYRLTSGLLVGNGQTAIYIDSDQVSLDLAGFSLRGSFGCAGPLPICSPDTGETGIWVDDDRINVTIANGAIRGMASAGIRALGALNLRVAEVAIHDCGNGIVASDSSGYGIVESVIVGRSAFAGIRATEGIQIRDSQFINNFAQGADGGACIRNVFRDNGDGQTGVEETCDILMGNNYCDGVPCP